MELPLERTYVDVGAILASDMDSIVSSLLYAFFLYVKSQPSKKDLYLACINIPREDLALRTETTWIFSQLHIDDEGLLFFPTVEEKLSVLAKKNRLQLILVDHNVLAKQQKPFESSVEEILDHHKDENLYSSLEIVRCFLIVILFRCQR